MRLLIALFALVLAALPLTAQAWPSDTISLTHMEPTGDPSQARGDLRTTMEAVKAIIAARGSSGGVASLDGGARLPVGQLPTTAVTTTATQTLTNKTITSPSISVTGNISHSKACESGYTRAGPGICILSTLGGTTDLRVSPHTSECRQVPTPDNATAVLLNTRPWLWNASTTGSKRYNVFLYGSSSCSSPQTTLITVTAYQNHTAFFDDHRIASGNATLAVTVPPGGLWVRSSIVGGINPTTETVRVIAYWDN